MSILFSLILWRLVLSPFGQVTDYAQTYTIVAAGYIIPRILGLKSELQDISKFNSKLVSTPIVVCLRPEEIFLQARIVELCLAYLL
jgi:hypothetical protein